MRILFTGGGTLGSVTPLLALYEELAIPPLRVRGGEGDLQKRGEVGLKAYWIGTRHGIEKELIERAGIPFHAITAGKLRRYFDWRNFFTPIETALGFFQALFLLRKLRPTHVFSAGGYVAVPVVVAAAALGIPSYAMQLDVRPGLANRLIAPFVKKMFVVFSETARFFSAHTAVVTGSVVRQQVKSQKHALSTVEGSKVKSDSLPSLLILGGGTGALRLNEIVVAALPELTKICRIVHITGKNKFNIQHSTFNIPSRYQHYDLLTHQLFVCYRDADLVVTRAGMGTLSELAFLAKAAIVIPLPRSHQEENAALLASHNAAIVLKQDALTPVKLVDTVTALLHDEPRRRMLGEKLYVCIPTDGAEKIKKHLTCDI